MRVKICGIKSEADVEAAVEAGADALGFLVGQEHVSQDFVTPCAAARLARSLPPYVTPTLVTHFTAPAAIRELVEETGITTVQLHGGSSPEEVAALREAMPANSKLILVAHVSDDAFSPALEDYFKLVDALLLDSMDRRANRVGGTGRTHNWNVSEEIVRSSPKPVVLAGGLTPVNVAEAIRKVRPFAVDVNSGVKNEAGGRSPKLCAEFVKNALEAFLELKKA